MGLIAFMERSFYPGCDLLVLWVEHKLQRSADWFSPAQKDLLVAHADFPKELGSRAR